MKLIAFVLLMLNLYYCLVILKAYLAWTRIPQFNEKSDEGNISYSLVIALRNESDRIDKLLGSLRQLQFPKDRLECIFVDDNSEDDTFIRLNEGLKTLPFDAKVIQMAD